VAAYAAEVKFKVLDVEPGPVVTRRCAAQMAAGAARLLGADIAVAVTGVGGPEPDEGRPAGTVYLAVTSGPHKAEDVIRHHFDGDPEQVVELSAISTLRLLRTALKATVPRTPAAPVGTSRSLRSQFRCGYHRGIFATTCLRLMAQGTVEPIKQ
jgi:hypothetical protein